MTALQVVGYCMTAFGLGYSAGALLRLTRRAFEVLE